MKIHIGYAVYSETTKHFVILDWPTGQFFENDSPFTGDTECLGVWKDKDEVKKIKEKAEKALNLPSFPKKNYKPVSLYAEDVE